MIKINTNVLPSDFNIYRWLAVLPTISCSAETHFMATGSDGAVKMYNSDGYSW